MITFPVYGTKAFQRVSRKIQKQQNMSLEEARKKLAVYLGFDDVHHAMKSLEGGVIVLAPGRFAKAESRYAPEDLPSPLKTIPGGHNMVKALIECSFNPKGNPWSEESLQKFIENCRPAHVTAEGTVPVTAEGKPASSWADGLEVSGDSFMKPFPLARFLVPGRVQTEPEDLSKSVFWPEVLQSMWHGGSEEKGGPESQANDELMENAIVQNIDGQKQAIAMGGKGPGKSRIVRHFWNGYSSAPACGIEGTCYCEESWEEVTCPECLQARKDAGDAPDED